jgi:hypothetical protein
MFPTQFTTRLFIFCLATPVGSSGNVPPFSAAVSMIVLIAALYVILSKRYPPKVEHWAYATVGTVLGFWLRG